MRANEHYRSRIQGVKVWIVLLVSIVIIQEDIFGGEPDVREITVHLKPEKNVGTGFDYLEENITKVRVILRPPDNYTIVDPKNPVPAEKSGKIMWNLTPTPTKPPTAPPSSTKHTWEGQGEFLNARAYVRFEGTLLPKPQGEEGPLPKYRVSVADIDIDVDSCDPPRHEGEHWPPYNDDSPSGEKEDRLEESTGLIVPPLVAEFPKPEDVKNYPYKELVLEVKTAWGGHYDDQYGPTPIGRVRFHIHGGGLKLFDPDTSKFVDNNQQIDYTGKKTFWLLTNRDFKKPVTISASFQWNLPSDMCGRPAVDRVRVTPPAYGELKLNMRQRTDSAGRPIGFPFVYPGKWEEENSNNIIQYKAVETKPGIISKIEISIYESNNPKNVVWRKDDFRPSTDWQDSTFRTRTNQENSVDADGLPNKDANGNFKFLDPGPDGRKSFSACLTLTLQNGTQIQYVEQFEVRARRIFYTRTADSPFEAFGKTYMWKLYRFTPEMGNTPIAKRPDVCEDPKQHDRDLFFGSSDKDNTLRRAYSCLTPRGNIYIVAHGASDAEGIKLDQTWWYGFQGPASKEGTKFGTPPIYDLTNVAEMHKVVVRFLACYTHRSNPPLPRFDCNVATSFKNSLQETIGGGGEVRGYLDVCKIWPGSLTWKYSMDAEGLTKKELDEILRYATKQTLRELANPELNPPVTAWYNDSQERVDEANSTSYSWSPEWLAAHTFKNVTDIRLSPEAFQRITEFAKSEFNKNHPNRSYTFQIRGLKNVVYHYSQVKVEGAVRTIPIPGIPPRP